MCRQKVKLRHQRLKCNKIKGVILLRRGVKQRHSRVVPQGIRDGSVPASAVAARENAPVSVCLCDTITAKADMKLSPQVELIIDVLRTSTHGGLKDEHFFSCFLQHAQSAGMQVDLGRLAFHGKYLRNVYAAIRRQTAETEGHEAMEKEFTRAVNDFHGMVSAFIADADEEFRSHAEQHALAVSEHGLRALLLLAEDFAALKNLELEMLQAEEAENGGENRSADAPAIENRDDNG